MSHGITESDQMFSVREKPWHGLGVVLDEYPASIDEAIEKSGLEWGVEQGDVLVVKRPEWTDDFGVKHEAEIVPATDFKANVRDDTGAILGIVSNDYKIVPNRDAFRFLDSLINSDLYFETAGSLHGGRRVWVLARIPEYIEVGGDQTATYLYVANSHDGSMAVTAAATPVRIVCANTLGFALRRSETTEGAQRTFKFRHTGDLQLKYDEARRVMDIAVNYAEQFKVMGDELATRKMNDPQVENVLTKLFNADDETLGDRAKKNRNTNIGKVVTLYRGQGEQGDTTGNSPGTAWALVNAIGEYADFGRRVTKRTNQMARSFEDQNLKQRGLDLVLAATE